MEKVYRAYSVLETKAYDEDDEKMTIKGIASTPTADRMNDIVEPKGARFKTPMPLLWQHDHSQPIGSVTFAEPNAKGIPFEAEIPKVKEAGRLKERLDEAMQSIKYKLVTAVSIGFRPIEDAYEYMENGGIRFKEWEWYELSAVTIPANSEAVISAIKSVDQKHLPPQRIKDDGQQAPTRPAVARRPIQLLKRKKA